MVLLETVLSMQLELDSYGRQHGLEESQYLPTRQFNPIDSDCNVDRVAWDINVYNIACNVSALEVKRGFFPKRSLIERAVQTMQAARLNALAMPESELRTLTHEPTTEQLRLPPGVVLDDTRSTATYSHEHTVHLSISESM